MERPTRPDTRTLRFKKMKRGEEEGGNEDVKDSEGTSGTHLIKKEGTGEGRGKKKRKKRKRKSDTDTTYSYTFWSTSIPTWLYLKKRGSIPPIKKKERGKKKERKGRTNQRLGGTLFLFCPHLL